MEFIAKEQGRGQWMKKILRGQSGVREGTG